MSETSNFSPWRTQPEIGRERQEYLTECLAIRPNVELGVYRFKGIELNRADVEWLLERRNSHGLPVQSTERQVQTEELDLRGANLRQVNLAGLPLTHLRGGLSLDEWLLATFEQRDMAGIHLEGANLDQADLRGGYLCSAHLADASLKQVFLDQADLAGADLRNAHLEQAELVDAHLREAFLAGVHLNGAILVGDLQWASLREARLEGAILREARLDNADVCRAHLDGAMLFRANLEGAFLGESHLKGASLREAHLMRAILREADLNQADVGGANLAQADLREALLERVDLRGTYLEGADLRGAYLRDADLSNAHLQGATLEGAHLEGANFESTQLQGADLKGVYFDEATRLAGAILYDRDHGSVSLADVHWGALNLAVVNWAQLRMLGDERKARRMKTNGGTLKSPARRLEEYQTAVRANHQLATVMRAQGLSEQADRFIYRAQVLQCRMLVHQATSPLGPLPARRMRRRHKLWYMRFLTLLGLLLVWPPASLYRMHLVRRLRILGAASFALFLDVLAGYGYRPVRTLGWYAVVILGFAVRYYLLGTHLALPLKPLSPVAALVMSVSSFHGRGFFPSPNLSLDNPLTVTAAIEAIVGLFIEISFIATFTQRFLGSGK
jgi:uncharacterized protein YjbI with pentapeptide repeats